MIVMLVAIKTNNSLLVGRVDTIDLRNPLNGWRLSVKADTRTKDYLLENIEMFDIMPENMLEYTYYATILKIWANVRLVKMQRDKAEEDAKEDKQRKKEDGNN